MLHRLMLVGAVSVFLAAPRMAEADPITYNFTGDLYDAPSGPPTLTGSLTFDATPPASDYSGGGTGQYSVGEVGSEVSLTLDVGGQVYHYQNNPQDPSTRVALGGFSVVPSLEVNGQPTVEFVLEAAVDNQVKFALTNYVPGLTAPPTHLTSQELLSGNFELTINQESIQGVMTSATEVEAPEPSSLLIFAGLGIGALIRKHRRGLRARRRREEAV